MVRELHRNKMVAFSPPPPSCASDAAADAATDATLCWLSLLSRLSPPSPSSSSEEINPAASPSTSGCLSPSSPSSSAVNLRRRRASRKLELYHMCWRMRTTVVEVYSMAVYSCVGKVGDTAQPSRLKKSPRGEGRARATCSLFSTIRKLRPQSVERKKKNMERG